VTSTAAVRVVTAALLAVIAGACGGSSRTYETDAAQILSESKQVVDASSSLHFKLTSEGAGSSSGIVIKGGEGDAVRPSGFAGSFDITRSGFSLSLKIVSSGGSFYVQLPFTTGYQKTDPGAYGFSDPGKLIDPSTGLSSLLSSTLSASLGDRDRLSGEELYEVKVTLPGQKIKDLLTSADPSQPVDGTIGINVDTHQARRVVLTGPFFQAGQSSTFTLLLTNYGESVAVTPPPG
jgi:hypothetical protein